MLLRRGRPPVLRRRNWPSSRSRGTAHRSSAPTEPPRRCGSTEELGRPAVVNRAIAGLDAAIGWVVVRAAGIAWAPGALEILRTAASPRAGLLGPLIRDPTRVRSPPAAPDRRSASCCGDASLAQSTVAGPTGWLDGRCVLVRRLAWDSVDGYDSRHVGTGTHPEPADVDLGDRLGRAGWLVVGVPEVEVVVHPIEAAGHPGRPRPREPRGGPAPVRPRPLPRARPDADGAGPTGLAPVREDVRVLDDVEAVVLVGGKGTRLRPLTLSAPKPMLPDRRGAVPGPPAVPHPRRRGAPGRARHLLHGRDLRHGVRRRRRSSASSSSTSSRTTRWAPAAASATSPSTSPRQRAGVQRRRAVRHRPARGRRHPPRPPRPTSRCTSCACPTPARTAACRPTPTARCWSSWRRPQDPPTDQINAGCYVFRRSVIDSIPEGRPVSVERETFPGLLAAGAAGVRARRQRLLARHGHARPTSSHGSADLVRGVAPSAGAAGPDGEALVLDGASGRARRAAVRRHDGRARRRRSARARGWTARCSSTARWSAPGAVVEQSIVGVGARIEEGATLRDTVVGDRAVVGAHCELRRGMRVWPDIVLPPHAVRFSPDV